MRILILSGSRNPEGQTGRAASALAEGAVAAGAEVETLFLPERHIERCRQCDARGWGLCASEGRCTIGDDFAEIADKIRRCDAVVFATPVYWGDLSESLRAFLDRLRRTSIHDDGRAGIACKRALGICVAGGGGGGAPRCTESMVTVLGHTGFDVVDLVPVRRQNLAMKLDVLRIAGRWLANGAPEE